MDLFWLRGKVGQFLTQGLVINYREGRATQWENRGSETFDAPQNRVKLFELPPFKERNFCCAPLQYG